MATWQCSKTYFASSLSLQGNKLERFQRRITLTSNARRRTKIVNDDQMFHIIFDNEA